MDQKIRIMYSCWTCGLKNAAVEVPGRTTEEIEVWMDATIALLGQDHDRRSPGCVPADGQLHDIIIPMPAGTTKVGGPVTH